jgi:hypothetical protein
LMMSQAAAIIRVAAKMAHLAAIFPTTDQSGPKDRVRKWIWL